MFVPTRASSSPVSVPNARSIPTRAEQKGVVGVSHADDGWDERPDDERLWRWPTVLALGVGLYVSWPRRG